MNKKFIYYFLAVVIVGALPKTASLLRSSLSENKDQPKKCIEETKICPDGTKLTATLPMCTFTACPVVIFTATDTPLQQQTATTTSQPATTTEYLAGKNIQQKTIETKTPETPKKVPIITSLSKAKETITSFVKTVTSSFTKQEVSNPVQAQVTPIPPSSYIQQEVSTSPYTPLPPTDFAGQKYIVKDGNILSNDNKLVYNIPQEVLTAVNSSNQGWTNNVVSVIHVGTVPPMINAIPVKDLPGKYYLSENSFGNMENCEFSNKIFILDTLDNSVTLMYEENNTTLSRDDPRACNSEIFLLATENEKLVLKYHTIGTNTLCDSAWSEPDKTYYLDVTKLKTEGMMRYSIPENLSANAEQEEEACRLNISTTTPE